MSLPSKGKPQASRVGDTSACPDWCLTSPEDHDDDRRAGDEPIHDGPMFGGWILTSRKHSSARFWVMTNGLGDDDGLDPSDLREMAADCLAAADWIEANS